MSSHYTAFEGTRRVAAGTLPLVAERCKALLDGEPNASPIIYDDHTGRPVDVDYRGTTHYVLARLPKSAGDDGAPARRGPGRPKLGVVAREVTLLPRHWEWLATQPGGASVALRRLVETASRDSVDADRVRQADEAVDRVMLALAGNLVGYEEASRAYHRREGQRFNGLVDAWPADVRDYVKQLAGVALAA